jgi:hypothetical protein
VVSFAFNFDDIPLSFFVAIVDYCCAADYDPSLPCHIL